MELYLGVKEVMREGKKETIQSKSSAAAVRGGVTMVLYVVVGFYCRNAKPDGEQQ